MRAGNGMRFKHWLAAGTLAAVAISAGSADAEEQLRGAATAGSSQLVQFGPAEPAVSVRGFGHLGVLALAASRSFEAVYGESDGSVFGGGAQVRLRNGLFFQFAAERFRKTGERVFVFEDEVFRLGIEQRATITPLLLTAGYRIARWGRLVPYAGGGVGWHGFREHGEFALPEEDVDERFTGYHLVGGTEVGLTRWVAAAAEVQWATVPDAIGDAAVSQLFGEDNLGGTTVRFKLIVGR